MGKLISQYHIWHASTNCGSVKGVATMVPEQVKAVAATLRKHVSEITEAGRRHFYSGGDVVVQLRPDGEWVAAKSLPPGVLPTPDATTVDHLFLAFQGAGSSLLTDQSIDLAIDDWEKQSTTQPKASITVHLP